jgi:nicotinate-nucleotide adenylyltransferase
VGVVKIGVMGGTFDPVHNGHIAIAREAWDRLALKYVVFIPAGNPWFKSESSITPAEQRLEMVRRAVEPYPYFQVSRLEIDRPGPTYTIDTIVALKDQIGSDENEIYFIVGWDSLAQLPQWYKASLLVKFCRLVAVPRPGYSRPALNDLEQEIPGVSERVILLDIRQMDISSTDIRNRVSRGLSLVGLVPEVVEKYIRDNGLYRDR